ncbi:MAG: hypothetical protein IOD12_09825 [Silvanigrellales bacterium]|jgi:hypothetical protein|nr:hypothetical protein [Silvanigrellales bacterium]
MRSRQAAIFHFFRIASLACALTAVVPVPQARANETFVNFSYTAYRVSTVYEDYQGSAGLGSSMEYLRSVNNRFGIMLAAEANTDITSKTLVFAGAAAGVTFNILGGSHINMESADLTFQATPFLNLFLFVLAGQYSYDVTGVVPPPRQLASGVRRRVTRVGTFVSPVVGMGMNLYTTPEALHTVSARAYARQSLNLGDLGITALNVAVGYGFAF